MIILTVPAHARRKVEGCRKWGADRILLDLEDGVPDDLKPEALANVIECAQPGDLVRVDPNFDCSPVARLDGVVVVLPKARSISEIPVGVVPIIEHPEAVLRAPELIFDAPMVLFGWIDFLLACGTNLRRSESLMWHAAAQVSIAAKARGIPCIFGPIAPSLGILHRSLVEYGFDGAGVTHPDLIPEVRAAFETWPVERTFAERARYDAIGKPLAAMAQAIEDAP